MGAFAREILPGLAEVPASSIAEATGLSRRLPAPRQSGRGDPAPDVVGGPAGAVEISGQISGRFRVPKGKRPR
jgi:hypothetical protein